MRIGGDSSDAALQGRQKVSVPMPRENYREFSRGGGYGGKGQGLVIVEAMKMENEVHSPIAGAVKEIKVKPGDTVEGGAVLVIVE